MCVECGISDDLRTRKKFVDRKLAILPKYFPGVWGDKTIRQIGDRIDLNWRKCCSEHVIPAFLILWFRPPLQDIAQQVVHSAASFSKGGLTSGRADRRLCHSRGKYLRI